MTDLLFRNNTNTADQLSVCLKLVQTTPTHILISNSTFQGNSAVYSTVAVISGAKSFTFQSVTCTGNTATSTSAGIIFTPLVTEDSSINVRDCLFFNNSALRSGLISIQENTGLMFAGSSHVTVTISNSTFSNNKSSYSGCSLTISGFVALSSQSVVTGNFFLNNTCGEGGAALYVGYVSGVITVENNVFWGNVGNKGTAIYSTHQGSSDGQTYLTVTNCDFRDNHGTSVIEMAGILTPLFITTGNSFTDNVGSCIVITATSWVDNDSSYHGNANSEGGVFKFLDESKAVLTNLTASKNFATIKGGVGSVSSLSVVVCTLCTFSENTSEYIGGVISMDQESVFNCTNCDFRQNLAGTEGSVIYALFSQIALSNCTVRDNQANSFGTIFLTESSLRMSECEMKSNVAVSTSPGIIAAYSNITLLGCTMWNHTADTGALFFTSVKNTIIIQNCSFFQNTANSGAVLYSMELSVIFISNSTFSSCTALVGGGIAQIRGSTVVFQNLIVSNITSPLSNGAIYLIQSVFHMSDSEFTDLQGSAIIAQTSYSSVTSSSFKGMVATFGSAIDSIDCYSLTVSSSKFLDNLSMLGGAIYSFTTGILSDELFSSYENNTFINNKAVNGGAIYSNSVLLKVYGNLFVNNSVSRENYYSALLMTGFGGAVYSSCVYISTCAVLIELNTFTENAAEVEGGAIYWFDSYPQVVGNVMKGNKAVYGQDIASFPIRVALLNQNHSIQAYLSNDTAPLVTTLSDIASGQILNVTFLFGLIDHYGQIISSDYSSAAQVVVNSSVVSISGTTQVTASAGVFVISQLTLTAQPKSIQTISVTSPGVETALKAYTGDPNAYYPTVSISVQFRDCVMGESEQNSMCYPCPIGTFSLKPSDPCNSCPVFVTCYGGYEMAPDPGYWRPDPTLNLFFACPNPDACLGSPASLGLVSFTGICQDGYSGNLCNTCMKGYSMTNKVQCGKCPSLTSNIIVSVLIVIFALSIGAFIIIVAIRGASQPRSELAVYLKIFTNYLQMVVVAASLSLKWPDFVTLFLNGQDTAGSVGEQLFSYDCIMQEAGVQQLYYTKITGTALLPAVLMTFIVMVWLLVSVCSRVSKLLHKLVASLVLIMFILHPSLAKAMFEMFSCMELKPGELWLIADSSEQCWSQNHVKNILTVSLPSIVVWIFGLPILCLIFLIKGKRKLTEPLIQLKFSFLYKGYQPAWYFWEFVILYRKVAIVCASVFLSTVSITVQALSVLAVLLLSLFFQLQVQPFILPNFNRLELKSILVSAVTIYSGLFYSTQSISNL